MRKSRVYSKRSFAYSKRSFAYSKRRFPYSKRSFAYYLLSTVLVISLISYHLSPVSAKDASPAASLTPIQEKLQSLEQEIASKAAQIKSQISQKISNKAFMGVITSIQDNPSASASGKLITITTPKGNQLITVNDFTVYQDTTTSKKPVTVKNFSQNDYVAALGDVDDKQVLAAAKLIKTKLPQNTASNMIWGQIQSVSSSQIQILDRDNKKILLALSSNTDIKVASDEATLKDIIPGNFLVSVGKLSSPTHQVSDFIYLTDPNGGQKIASASATATPSASPNKK
jgi:hypothetical protein